MSTSPAPVLLRDLLQRAVEFHRRGELTAAAAAYAEVLKVAPRHADALHLSGVVAAQARDFLTAVRLIDQALEIDPTNSAAYGNLGGALHGLRRLPEALAAYDKAIAVNPEFIQAHLSRGNLLHELKDLPAALESFDRVIALNPDVAAAHLNRGNVLRELDRFEAAIASYDKAIELDPPFAFAHFNRGVALNQLKQPYAALESYDRALAIDPNFAEAHFNRGLVLLLTGNYVTGWRENEWRWQDRFSSNVKDRRHFAEPQWQGDVPLAGKTILLHAEQGFGDTLQMCRYVRLVAERGGRVILEAPKPLESLLTSLHGVSALVTRGDPLPRFDLHCPLMSLPLAFNTELHTIPAPTRYLNSDRAKVAVWEQRLGAKSAPRIGLCWRGNPIQPNDRNRSFALAQWISHLPPGFRYVSLQRDVCEGDARVLEQSPGVYDASPYLSDFSDTAALCDCLDLVVSVCTSVAHLSGALGNKTWILLSYAADWRWLLDRSDSPWYPSATLYRQTRRGDWASVFASVGRDLVSGFPS